MKVTIDLPDRTKALSVTAIYEREWGSFDMGNNMYGTSMLKDGAELTFIIKKVYAEDLDDGKMEGV